MAKNSFALKGWTVTLISAMFALAAKDVNRSFVILAYFPVIMFWILDSYYLSQEKYFIAIYNEVRKKSESSIDFSMKSETTKWNLYTWIESSISPTIGIFYGLIIILLIVIMFII
jgi:tetrahydromethanopterin S-methyltransferase subunit G